MKRVCVLMLVFCVLASSAVAQEEKEQPPAHEHLKVLEPLIGTWAFEATADRDYPDLGIKAGDRAAQCWSWQWCLNGNAVLCRHWVEDASKKELAVFGIGIVGWNPESEQIVENRVSGSAGSRSERIYEKGPEAWIVRVNQVSTTGSRSTRDVVLKIAGDTLRFQRVNQINTGGEKLPDSPITEFSRRVEE